MDLCSMVVNFSRNYEEKFQSYGISTKMDGSENCIINGIENESGNNDNGDGSSIGSDSECHKHVCELLINDTI
jgi:hypothetical protein